MRRFLLLILFFPLISSAQYVGLQFDGGGDYIKTACLGVAGAGSRSVQCWYKGFTNTNQRFFVDMGLLSSGNGGRFSLKINGSTSVARIEIGGGGLNGTVNISNNAWHQITVVYDDAAATNKYKLYIDGALDVQGDIAIPLNTPATIASPVTIGIRTDLDLTTDLFGGLDEVRIWSVPLTAAQILANYNTEICGTPAGLIAYYKMNEGVQSANNTAITSLIDEVNPSSVNTLFGFAMTGNSSNYTFHLLPLVNTTSTSSVSNCGTYFWSQSGSSYGNSGTYYDTVPLWSGCDSIYVLNLTINPIPPAVMAVSSCEAYTWPSNNQTYTSSGSYNDTLTSNAGCDSILTLNLTITPIPPTLLNVSSCLNYTWPVNGVTYLNSGVHTDTLVSSLGCDSIVILNLTINQSTSSTANVSACFNYLWAPNNMNYTASGVYFDTIVNSEGCDSILQLVLTIETPSFVNTILDTCTEFVWPFNNQLYTASGFYIDTVYTTSGCTIGQLDLSLFTDMNTVTNTNNGELAADISGGVYQWINCSNNSFVVGATNQTFVPDANGSYAVITYLGDCMDTSACNLISNVGLENSILEDFEIYPNPITDVVYISNMEPVFLSRVSVSDIQGKLIQTVIVNKTNASIDFSGLSNGVYYLLIETTQGSVSNHRVVKN